MVPYYVNCPGTNDLCDVYVYTYTYNLHGAGIWYGRKSTCTKMKELVD